MANTQHQNLYIPKASHQNIPMKMYVHLQQAKNRAFIAERMPNFSLWHHIVVCYKRATLLIIILTLLKQTIAEKCLLGSKFVSKNIACKPTHFVIVFFLNFKTEVTYL